MAGEFIQVLGKSAWFAWGSCPTEHRDTVFTLESDEGDAIEIGGGALCIARQTFQQATAQGAESPLKLPFKKSSLSKVVEYLNYHEEIKPFEIRTPLESDNLIECGCSKWDATFINMDKDLLFDIMVMAITMDIPSLYFLAGAKATLMIKGKEPSKLIKDFKLANDLPDDEEEQLTSVYTAQKEAEQVNPDESGLGGVAVIMNGIFQAAERNGVLAPSKTEDACPSSISLKSYRHAIWRAMILSDWTQMQEAPEEVLADRDLFFACVAASRGAVLEWAPGEFREDKALILEAVKLKGENLVHADDALRSDKDFVMEAIQVDGTALCGAADILREDQDFILAACQLGKGSCFKGVKDSLKYDKEFVLRASCLSAEAFKYAGEEIRWDKDFATKAVSANGLVLQHVPNDYKFDRSICQAAVNSDPDAAQFAHVAVRLDLKTPMAYDGESNMAEVKKMQDKAGVGGKQQPKGLVQWARQPMDKDQAREDGIVYFLYKEQKIVQFSALSTMTANMGQSNYVAANCFLDKMPFYERPETDAVTLMWGAVGNIGMRWKAFASQDMLNANPEALMQVVDAAKVLTMTATRMDPPEWYAASFFDEWTRASMLAPTAGVHSGGGYRPGENYQAPARAVESVIKEKEAKEYEPSVILKAEDLSPLGGWPTLFEEPAEPAATVYELEEGMRVQLRGLNPAKNGLMGTAIKMCKDKWRVRLDKGENALLKAEYLVPASAAPSLEEESAKEKLQSEERRARMKAAARAY